MIPDFRSLQEYSGLPWFSYIYFIFNNNCFITTSTCIAMKLNTHCEQIRTCLEVSVHCISNGVFHGKAVCRLIWPFDVRFCYVLALPFLWLLHNQSQWYIVHNYRSFSATANCFETSQANAKQRKVNRMLILSRCDGRKCHFGVYSSFNVIQFIAVTHVNIL